jgi:transcriptional regulator with XRE-family HTH domain
MSNMDKIHMTADEVLAARKELGLTQAQFAQALGRGTYGLRQVGRWESGAPVSAAVAVAIQSLLGRHRNPVKIDADLEFWRIDRLKQVTGLSRSEIYNRVRTGTFPQQRHYDTADGGPDKRDRKAAYWTSVEVRAWQARQLGDDFERIVGRLEAQRLEDEKARLKEASAARGGKPADFLDLIG